MSLSTHQTNTIKSLEHEIVTLKADIQKIRGLETEVKELQEWKLECSRKSCSDAENVITMNKKLKAMETTLHHTQELLQDCKVQTKNDIRSMSNRIETEEAKHTEAKDKYQYLERRIEELESKQEIHSGQIKEWVTCCQDLQEDINPWTNKVVNDIETLSKELEAVKMDFTMVHDVKKLAEKVEIVESKVQNAVEVVQTCEEKNENSLQFLLNQTEVMNTQKDEMYANTKNFREEMKELMNMLQSEQEEFVTTINNNMDSLHSTSTLLEAHCAYEFASVKCTLNDIVGTTYQDEESSAFSGTHQNLKEDDEQFVQQEQSISNNNNGRLRAIEETIDSVTATQAVLTKRIESLSRNLEVSKCEELKRLMTRESSLSMSGERLSIMEGKIVHLTSKVEGVTKRLKDQEMGSIHHGEAFKILMMQNPLFEDPAPITFEDLEEPSDDAVFAELLLESEASSHSSDNEL